MATKEKKQKKADAQAVEKPHRGVGTPAPQPRLKEYYETTVRQRLMQQFGYTNPHQIPKLEKIVVNVGLGEAIKQPKLLDGVVNELASSRGSDRCASARRSRSRTSACAKGRRSARA